MIDCIVLDLTPDEMREHLLRGNLMEYAGPSDEPWVCAFPSPCLPFEEMERFDGCGEAMKMRKHE
jgi:hypothetical protein